MCDTTGFNWRRLDSSPSPSATSFVLRDAGHCSGEKLFLKARGHVHPAIRRPDGREAADPEQKRVAASP
jgi:hypothetical protein